MKPFIYPYKLFSSGAASIAANLDVLMIKEAGKFVHTAYRPVVNWGNPRLGRLKLDQPLLNKPESVNVAINKLATLNKLQECNVPIPEFTTSKAVALQWLNAGKVVFARTKLRSKGGDGCIWYKKQKGLEVVDPNDLVDAPLYTLLFSKQHEYRVHVFKDKVIDFTQKKKVEGFEKERDPYVRSHMEGWIFARESVTLPQSAEDAAVLAVRALGLDFGAVDIADNKDGLVCVFEVNTAPGLEGTTTVKYSEAITNWVKEQEKNVPTTKRRISIN
jgi:hypothetical protein